MTITIGIYSYLFAAVAYGFLTLLLLISRRGQSLSAYIIAAAALSTVWAATLSVEAWSHALSAEVIQLAELLRNGSWGLFLLKVIANPQIESSSAPEANPWSRYYVLLLSLAFAFLCVAPQLGEAWPWLRKLLADFSFLVWVALALVGLLLIEQIYRNTSASSRGGVQYLCLGLGGIFAYDFFMYAQGLLLKNIDPVFWHARGIVNAMAVPLLAISIARNPNWQLRIHVSRHIVFQSITLMGAGLYLLAMAIAGYFIRFLGGSWGGFIQIVFLFASGLLLVTLLFSGQIRARLRVLLSKHFFSYKYDYRQEWSDFTSTLTESGDNVPERVIAAMANLVHSTGGLLWVKQDQTFKQVGHWGMPAMELSTGKDLANLAAFASNTQWVVDLKEYRSDPATYAQLDLSDEILTIPKAWLVIPMSFNSDVLGLLLIEESSLENSINWEDRDLLKVAGQQAASHLAQYQANLALVQSRQFEAFNRLSAYVIHDLKNILAQQSLIVSNAEKHKDNPAFVDDVIKTVKNSVERMTRLMEQMRSGIRGVSPEPLHLGPLLTDVVERCSARRPAPTLEHTVDGAIIEADKEQLSTVFSHLIQNAQEATSKNGQVSVRATRNSGAAHILIHDTGSGMDAEFIKHRLFKPFDSTKGLTGMGVGAFESRELIRSLGGEINVQSEPGTGSTFTIVLPCVAFEQENNP